VNNTLFLQKKVDQNITNVGFVKSGKVTIRG
jgi:hypothetical protein